MDVLAVAQSILCGWMLLLPQNRLCVCFIFCIRRRFRAMRSVVVWKGSIYYTLESVGIVPAWF